MKLIENCSTLILNDHFLRNTSIRLWISAVFFFSLGVSSQSFGSNGCVDSLNLPSVLTPSSPGPQEGQEAPKLKTSSSRETLLGLTREAQTFIQIYGTQIVDSLEITLIRAKNDEHFKAALARASYENNEKFWSLIAPGSPYSSLSTLHFSYLSSFWVFPLFKAWALTSHSFRESGYFKSLPEIERTALLILSLPIQIEEFVLSGNAELEKKKRESGTQMLTREQAYAFTQEERLIPLKIEDCTDCPRQMRFTKASYKHSMYHFANGLDPINNLADALVLARKNATSVLVGSVSPNTIGNSLAFKSMGYFWGDTLKTESIIATKDQYQGKSDDLISLLIKVNLKEDSEALFRFVVCRVPQCQDSRGNIFLKDDVVSMIPLWGDGVVNIPYRSTVKKWIEDKIKTLPPENYRFTQPE